MPAIHVRPATPADVPLILSLIRELADYERGLEHVRATEDLLRAALFDSPAACECLIGEVDALPQGFALFFHSFSTWEGRRGLYLEDLFVRPAARGFGLGRALLRHLARLAVERGCTRMDWSVLDWNRTAIDFYLALGAKPMDEWTAFRVTGEALVSLGAGG